MIPVNKTLDLHSPAGGGGSAFRGETGLIRIRDNCAQFNPVHYIDLHRHDDPTAHLGIRLVMAAAKSASYLNSYGLNNLTLQL